MKNFNYNELTKQAINYCYLVYKDKTRSDGLPFTFLLDNIVSQLNDDYLICVVLLHNIFEDNNNLELLDDIRSKFPKEVVDALDIYSHVKDGDFLTYFVPLAKKNKLAKKSLLLFLYDFIRIDNKPLPLTWNSLLRIVSFKKAIEILTNKNEQGTFYLVELIENNKPDHPRVECLFNVKDHFKFILTDNEEEWEKKLNQLASEQSQLLITKVADYDLEPSDDEDEDILLRTYLNDYKITLVES
jgi:hypothetical protein